MTPEHKAKLLEARKNAIPKSTYTSAIISFCRQCLGSEFTNNCNNAPCLFYLTRSIKASQKISKTRIKKLIAKHCKECLGIYALPRDYAVCSSPSCTLYPHRYKTHEKTTPEQ